MSFETTPPHERFRLLNRLFEEYLKTDPEMWDELTMSHAIDPRLIVEARRLLSLERSGAPDRYLTSLVKAAQAVVRADPDGVQNPGSDAPS